MIFYCHGINTKVSQLLDNCGDTDLSHRHLLCKCQYNSGDTDLSHRHLLCKLQYNYGDTDMSRRHFLCKRQYNYGDKDTSAANANITAATSRPGPSGDTARRRPFQPLWILRLPHRAVGAQRRHRAPQRLWILRLHRATGAQQRHRAPQTLLAALDTAPATQSHRGPAATLRAADPSSGSGYCTCHTKPPGPSGDTARRNPF